MKKISFLLILILFLNNCAMNKELLNADGADLPDKLLPLKFDLSSSIEKSVYLESVGYQDYLTTIFKREFEENVFLNDKNTYGYLDLKIIYDEKTPNYLYQVILFPIYVPYSIFGMPYSITEREIDLELTVYNINKKKIKSYTASFSKALALNIYNTKVMKEMSRLKISKVIIEDLKKQLMKDMEFLNQQLYVSRFPTLNKEMK